MKRIPHRDENMKHRVKFAFLALFVALLPFDRFYSQLALAGLLIHVLLHFKYRQRPFPWKNFLVCSGLYLLSIIAMIWTPQRDQGLFDLEKQASLLLMPLALALIPLRDREERDKLLRIFGWSCTIAICYLYVDAFRVINHHELPSSTLFSRSFINHSFSEPIGMHATYLSMYAAFSFICFVRFFIRSGNIRTQVLYAIALLILAGGIVQLSSRAVFIALIAIIAIVFPMFLFRGIRRLVFLSLTIIFFLAGAYSIFQISSFRERYITGLQVELAAKEPARYGEPRVKRWTATVNDLGAALITGYGTGSEKKVLNNVYYENQLYLSYLEQFNAHNQYLSLLIKFGLPGLALFLLILFTGFRTASKNRDLIFLSFLLLITAVSFSENILDINKGIFFFIFFSSTFLMPYEQKATLRVRQTILKQEYASLS